MVEEKIQLLAHIQTACLNFEDVEPVTLTKWEEMSIEELRTVAILLNDEMVMLLNGARRLFVVPISTVPLVEVGEWGTITKG